MGTTGIGAGAACAHLRRRIGKPCLEQPSESAAGQLDHLDRPTSCNASWRFSIMSGERVACAEHGATHSSSKQLVQRQRKDAIFAVCLRRVSVICSRTTSDYPPFLPDVTPELMGLAGYIMARSNSAHKLPGYIRRDALAVKIMLRLSQRPRGLLPPAARR